MPHLISEKVMTQKMVIILFGLLTPKWLKISSMLNYVCHKTCIFTTVFLTNIRKENKAKQGDNLILVLGLSCRFVYDVFNYNEKIMGPRDKSAIAK